MAISVSGTDLVLISATSNTTTTNTTFNANAPNDSNYFLPNSILAGVSTGVTIDGFGLFLWATLADKNLDMINDGTIAVTQPAAALTLVATGGAVSYLGAGTISSADGPGLAMGNRNAGTVAATISNAVSSSSAEAITMVAEEGAVSLTQQAAGTLAAAPLFNAVLIQTTTGSIHATLNGTVSGGQGMLADSGGNITVDVGGTVTAGVAAGVKAETQGAITLNSSGSITAGTAGLQLTGHGAGPLTVNMTAGKIAADVGIDARSLGSGDILVDMTGGQLGDSANRVDVGIKTGSAGAGDTDITATTIFATGNAIETLSSSTGNIKVTVDGVVDSLNAQGILISGNRPEAATVINNGTIRAVVGLTSFRPTEIINAGTIIGTLGAISLNGPGTDDTLTLTPTSVIVGRVFAGAAGNDRLQLGGSGTGHFDVGTIGTGQQYLGFETFNVIGANLDPRRDRRRCVERAQRLARRQRGAWRRECRARRDSVARREHGGAVDRRSVARGGRDASAEIGGTTPGTGYDQLGVNGTVTSRRRDARSVAHRRLRARHGTASPSSTMTAPTPCPARFSGSPRARSSTPADTIFAITYHGGNGNDVVLRRCDVGTPGDDNFTAPAGAEPSMRSAASTRSRSASSSPTRPSPMSGNQVIIDGPSSHTVLTGFERFVFTDGTVDNADGNRLVDDLFYYSQNHDVWNAHVDADAHYRRRSAGTKAATRARSSTPSIYLSANPDVTAAGIDPLTHFDHGRLAAGPRPLAHLRPARTISTPIRT